MGRIGSLLMCTMLTMYGCKNDQVKMPSDSELMGKWEVFYSEMNNKPNDLMAQAHFLFLDENRVESNFFDDQSYEYLVQNGRLKIESPDNFDLAIDYFQNDTIIMSGKLKYYNLKLKMVKVRPN